MGRVKRYNPNDLRRGTYKYEYPLTWYSDCGVNRINVIGERSGIFILKNNECYDLVGNCVVGKKDIIQIDTKTIKEVIANSQNIPFELKYKDSSSHRDSFTTKQITSLLKKIDEELDYKAHEEQGSGGYGEGSYYYLIPECIEYESSEEPIGALEREFEANLRKNSQTEGRYESVLEIPPRGFSRKRRKF